MGCSYDYPLFAGYANVVPGERKWHKKQQRVYAAFNRHDGVEGCYSICVLDPGKIWRLPVLEISQDEDGVWLNYRTDGFLFVPTTPGVKGRNWYRDGSLELSTFEFQKMRLVTSSRHDDPFWETAPTKYVSDEELRKKLEELRTRAR